MKKIFTILFALVASIGATAQHIQHRCGADHMHHRLRNEDPEFQQRAEDYNRQLRELIANNRQNRDGEEEEIIIIPVVFHIVHNFGIENISDEQIFDQMRILNEDFRKLNADTSEVIDFFKPIVADSRIEFRLAQRDFAGNCTNGIDRVASIETYIGDDGSKLNPWPRDRYLNVWVVNSMENGVAGYAYYPSAVPNGTIALRDGIIIRHNYIGSIGTGSPGTSRALTHEIGHWLNLQHVWGDNNEPTLNCGDDDVLDTPETAGFDNCSQLNNDYFNCDSQPFAAANAYTFSSVTNTSGSEDPTENFQFDNDKVVLGQFKAVGLSENSVAPERFAFKNWPTTEDETPGLDPNRYYEFTISTDLGTSMTLTGIRFQVRRNGLGPRKYAVRSGNFSSNLQASVSPLNANLSASQGVFTFVNDVASPSNQGGTLITLSGAAFTTVRNNTITFRIYAWDAESAEGTFEIDNVEFLGSFGSIENIQNYMEYSYCSVMFTEGQKERMRAALALTLAGRNNLYSQSNLEFTGVINNEVAGCWPKADFYPERPVTCLGEPVIFLDYTQNSTATEHFWDFGDGGTSTERNPEVTFWTPGWKTVTYTAINEFGQGTKTKAALYVIPEQNYQSGLITENFSDQNLFNQQFIVRNLDNNSSAFQWTNETGLNDLGCVKLNAFDMDASLIDTGNNDIDELIMPAVDLSNYTGSGATFSFNYSYATQAANIADVTDQLIVQTSRNCGVTWQDRTPIGATSASITGTSLVTAGSFSSSFVPASSSDWRTVTYTLPNTLYEPNVLFKFVFRTGDYPNNLYIDNFAVSGTVGIDEVNAGAGDFYIYPNPANDAARVEFSLKDNQDVNIMITDLSGRIVYSDLLQNRAAGMNNVELPLNNFADGMYMVSLRTNNNTVSQRLIVRK